MWSQSGEQVVRSCPSECVVHGSQSRSPGAEPPVQGSLPGTLKQVSGEYVLSFVEFTSGTGAQGLTCAQPKFSLSDTPHP